MQKFMKKRKARGFTLIEMLIVIIIIGILAGALLLAAGAGTDKAEATRIVSDLRTIKTSAVMYYADYGDWPSSGDSDTELTNWLGSWDEYGDREYDNTKFDVKFSGDVLLVGYKDVETGVDKELKKIQDNDGGLYTSSGSDYTSGAEVYIKIK